MRILTRGKRILLTAVLINSAALADTSANQTATQPVDSATSSISSLDSAKLSRAQARLARAQAIADRFAGQAAALGYADNAWRYELVNHLMKVDRDALDRIESTADLSSAMQAASAAAASADQAQPKVLGDSSDDLVYTPITPCRIVDTRNAGAGGAFSSGETRTYTYTGSTAQGGTACVTSTVTPAALAVNITTVATGLGSPSAVGYLSVFPQGGSKSTSWMNFAGNETLANAGVTTINQSNGQFSVFAQYPTQLLVDVFGVLRPPQANGTLNRVTKWTPNANTLGTSSIYDDGAHVGIFTSAPTSTFQIGPTAAGFVGDDLAIGNNGQIMAFAQQTDSSRWYTSNNFALLPSGGTGNVGIGITAPANKLQIGSVGSSGFSGNDIAFGNGSVASGIAQTASVAQWLSTTNMALVPGNGAGGNLGINTLTPANKLQIGSVGSSGYAGNDIAFGNGTQATGIAQTASTSQWYSTTNIALLPQGNGHGRVGINTVSPQAPLEVDDFNTIISNVTYFTKTSSGLETGTYQNAVSIYAASDVYAQDFDAYSDARIKRIRGVSDTAKDLDTLNALQITDYTMIDQVKNGDRPFKKVIAQQVETVYPQVVSKHVDFIPNVYQLTSRIEAVEAGYRLTFKIPHGLSKTATRLKLMTESSGLMQQVDIASIPSEREVIVKASDWTAERVFVYGEQVDDFRTVDYDGLTSLNIAATQQLSKLLGQQRIELTAKLAEKDAQITELRSALSAQSARLAQFESVAEDLAQMKSQLASLQHAAAPAQPVTVAMRP